MTQPLPHIVLLGDSIFDNAVYVPNGLAVINHLQGMIPPDWRATLLAHDGDVIADVAGQLSRLPETATHLVISVGGNDALMALNVFSLPARSVNDALSALAQVRKNFQRGYRAMLWQALSHQRPVTVCTIYDAVPGLTPESQTALALFNDTITREALAANVPVIDLRNICTEADDYAATSPIEPSEQGGGKIAKAIVERLPARYRMRYFIDCWAGECLWSANEKTSERYGYPVTISELGLSAKTIKMVEEILCRAYQMACTTPDVYGVSYEFSDEEIAAHRKDVAALLNILRHELGPNFEIVDES